VPYTVGVPNIPFHHLLRSAVRRFPLRPAIFFEGSRLTYRRLNHETNRFANALLALGWGKGARVVLLLPNVPQMVIGFYGTMKAGATAVFVPPVIEPEESRAAGKEFGCECDRHAFHVGRIGKTNPGRKRRSSYGVDRPGGLSFPAEIHDLELAQSRLWIAQLSALEGFSGRQ
jgi:hypothetical protein